MPRLWRDAGLSPMRTDMSSSESSRDSSGVISARASVGGELLSAAGQKESPSPSRSSCEEGSSYSEGSGFNTDVSDRKRERKRHMRMGDKLHT